MNYTIGQQLLGGKVVVVSINAATGVIVIAIYPLGDGVGNPFLVTYDPNETTKDLTTFAQDIIDALNGI